MSITDELREYAHDCCARVDDAIHAIADRIDAEHQKAMSMAGQLLADAEKDRDYNYANWQDCKQKVLQHNITIDELSAEIERLKDELAHCIEMPKDADGEYIQPSDIPRLTKANDGKRLVFCPSLELRQDGTWSLAGWTPDMYRISKPTVEDVLREFTDAILEWSGKSGTVAEVGTWSDVAAEYAKRLTLAEVEDA